VTGASSGIGAAVARALADAGHPVALGARRVARCEQLAAQIRADGGEAVALPLDVADGASAEAFVKAATEALGPLEVLVSNAGNNGPGSALDTDPAAFAATLQVNVLGAHRLVRLVVPDMVARRRGDVVFVTSDTARQARPGTSAYVTSKWGLEGYARALQLELEGTGVRASIVQPGQTRTEMGLDWDPGLTTRILEDWIRFGFARHGNFLRPDAVAGAVLAAVSAPRGTHLTMIEVQPEAPIAAATPPATHMVEDRDAPPATEKGGSP